jgi:CheY-like chemotaxis protein
MKKILIVDDNQLITKTVSMKFRSAGYSVLTAEDGGTAVSLARRERPDVILLDINFPPDVANGGGVPWDGFLIMNWLRRMDEAKNIPIVIISGEDPAKYGDRAVASGIQYFFRKPLQHDELLATVAQLTNPVAN